MAVPPCSVPSQGESLPWEQLSLSLPLPQVSTGIQRGWDGGKLGWQICPCKHSHCRCHVCLLIWWNLCLSGCCTSVRMETKTTRVRQALHLPQGLFPKPPICNLFTWGICFHYCGSLYWIQCFYKKPKYCRILFSMCWLYLSHKINTSLDEKEVCHQAWQHEFNTQIHMIEGGNNSRKLFSSLSL